MAAPRMNPMLMSPEVRANLEKFRRAQPASAVVGGVSASSSPDGKLRTPSPSAGASKQVKPRTKTESGVKSDRIPKGARFGDLTVISAGRTVNKSKMSLCRCSCGAYTVVGNANLASGRTTSCGFCRPADGATQKSGCCNKTRHPLHAVWCRIKERCHGQDSAQYHNYGARGISVCEEWKKSFKAFQQWAFANGWIMGRALSRIDPAGNYEPGNCAWTSIDADGVNTGGDVLLSYKGETKSVTKWAEETGLYRSTIIGRIHDGWAPEDVLEKPVNALNRSGVEGECKYVKFALLINPMILSTGQQKKMNFVTKTIFTDSRVENGMRLVEMAAKPHTEEIHRVCPPGTRIALTVTFLCPYPSGTPEDERVERGLMGECFDCDNKYKAIGDAFTNAGWWPDDRFVTTLKIEKRRTTALPRIEVILEPDIIREPSLLSDESLLEDSPIATEYPEEESLSLFSSIDKAAVDSSCPPHGSSHTIRQ